MTEERYESINQGAKKSLAALAREIERRTDPCNIQSITIEQGEERFVAVVREGHAGCNTTLLMCHWGETRVDAIWLSDELQELLGRQED